eukprot:789706-Prymnesium_polylepis.1
MAAGLLAEKAGVAHQPNGDLSIDDRRLSKSSSLRQRTALMLPQRLRHRRGVICERVCLGIGRGASGMSTPLWPQTGHTQGVKGSFSRPLV